MGSVNLTDRKIKTLKPKSERQEYSDANQKGFGLRVNPSGAKVFFYLYRNKHGQRRRFFIGEYPIKTLSKARDDAKALAAAVAKGEDPAQEKRAHKVAETVAELCELFLEVHSRPNKKPRSVYEDERIIAREVLPAFGHYKAVDVGRRDIMALLDSKRKTPTLANRIRALLHRVFNFALHRDLVKANPCAGLPKLAKETARDRVLSVEEIAKLFKQLNKDPDPVWKAWYKLILYTGQRPGEVGTMLWSEILGDTWTIPPEKAKNGLKHRVFLAPPVRHLLGTIKAANAERKELSRKEEKSFYDQLVFASRYGTPIRWSSHKTKRLVEAMGIPDWRPHDLRRTMATHLENSGVPGDVIEQILNHKKRGVAQVYQRGDRWTQCVSALNAWARRLQRIESGKTASKVVALR